MVLRTTQLAILFLLAALGLAKPELPNVSLKRKLLQASFQAGTPGLRAALDDAVKQVSSGGGGGVDTLQEKSSAPRGGGGGQAAAGDSPLNMQLARSLAKEVADDVAPAYVTFLNFINLSAGNCEDLPLSPRDAADDVAESVVGTLRAASSFIRFKPGNFPVIAIGAATASNFFDIVKLCNSGSFDTNAAEGQLKGTLSNNYFPVFLAALNAVAQRGACTIEVIAPFVTVTAECT